MAPSTRRAVSWAALAAGALPHLLALCQVLPGARGDLDIVAANAQDDECLAGRAAGQGDAACALSARQLRGEVRSHAALEEAGGESEQGPLLGAMKAAMEKAAIEKKMAAAEAQKKAAAAAAAAQKEAGPFPGKFISSKASKEFEWTPPKHTIQDVLNTAPGWSDRTFPDGNGKVITKAYLATWVEEELFSSAAFAEHSGKVPIPWPEADGDQVGAGNYVGYSRRQVCYIVAKALMGSTLKGYNNGLTRFMAGCPRKGEFGTAMVVLLASCAADPGLEKGGQGPLLLAVRAKGAPDVAEARSLAADTPLSRAGFRICQYDDGVPSLDGIDKVPADGCKAPTNEAVGVDFMTGGLQSSGKAQAVQDISAGWLGGYIFGNVCGLGGGQDERLMVYFPEVAALAFFLSQGDQYPQLRQPAWVLGARKFFTGLDGSARFDAPLVLDPKVWIKADLKTVTVGEEKFSISSSRPFLGFMSENQGFFGYENHQKLMLARRNKHPDQRLAGDEKFAFEKQVRAWYGSVALTSYAAAVQPALKTVVGSIGTGPWLAGLWWGDSQLGMLAVWIGQAIAAPTWGGDLPVDYYLYSDFTENPGNQCFVHSKANCAACLNRCSHKPLPKTAFWLPDYAFSAGGSCAESAADCGEHGIQNVLQAYGSKSAGALWSDVETSIRGKGTDLTVFDLLMR